MSLDIDMESFGRNNEPAAVVPQAGFNSYTQEEGEYVHQEFLEPAQDSSKPESPVQDIPEPTNTQADNFRALREEVDRLKSERENEKREHQLQMEMMRANQAPVQRQPEPQRKEMFDGMKDDDIPNVAELRKEWSQREADYQSRLEELQVQQMHPDYEEVITKYAIPLVKQKPHLAEGLQGARNKALFAYELGAMARQMQQPVQEAPKRSVEAERIVENSKKPGTLSQAGGQSTLSKADYFATMSDEQFMRMASKNLEGI